METKQINTESHLIRLCIDAATRDGDAVDKWRRQRRSLERLPSRLAEALIYGLLRRRIFHPSLLELFKNVVEEIDLKGENSVDAEWMAYLGGFRCLRSLSIAQCYRITNSALWSISGMTTLKAVDLSRCSKITDTGIRHVLSIPGLEEIYISGTGVTAKGVMLLASLKKLSVLDIGGLPVTDQALNSLQELKRLKYLDVWGSRISNKGASTLKIFPNLTFLNLAWTDVTELPNLPSLTCLNMSNCAIHSIYRDGDDKSHLEKLIVSEAIFANELQLFSYIGINNISFLNVSKTSIHNFSFLPDMISLKHLDLSFCEFGDESVDQIVHIGINLRHLNLNNTKVSSAGLGNLAGHVPNLEVISLSHSPIDDDAIFHISMMPSLKVIDLSYTNVKGTANYVDAETDLVLSLTALQSLEHLESLNLEETRITDTAIYPLSDFHTLTHLSLKRFSLTDVSLHHLLSLHKLKDLAFRDAVLTDAGLDLFNPPFNLRTLDLRGCWLLTKEGILSFCKIHPQIELIHELAHVVPSDQIGLLSRKTPQSKQKQGKVLALQSNLMGNISLDQRLKYTREELLQMQTSPVIDIPDGNGIIASKMLD